jgi:hypothetical protein
LQWPPRRMKAWSSLAPVSLVAVLCVAPGVGTMSGEGHDPPLMSEDAVNRGGEMVSLAGAEAGDLAGATVAGAGDINGDKAPDLILGAPQASLKGRKHGGAAYVVFGGASLASRDLARLGSRGIRIIGAAAGDQTGASVAGAGDVNGDGFDDVLVGAPTVASGGRPRSGATYLVLGSPDLPREVDLRSPPFKSVKRIEGKAAGDQTGFSVAGAGDVNGDGKADLVVGALRSDGQGKPDAGAAYLLFGADLPSPIDLREPPPGVKYVRIVGGAPGNLTASAVAAAGDVNGDGFSDVLIGAPRAANNSRQNSGSVYLVFGSCLLGERLITSSRHCGLPPTRRLLRGVRKIDLERPSSRFVRIDGAAGGDLAGTSLAGGDMNGDGLDDVILGAPLASHEGRRASGSAFVVLGRTAFSGVIDLRAEGSATRIDGAAAGHLAGQAVAALGDVDQDGREEIAIGAPRDWSGRPGAGAAYLIPGQGALPPVIDLAGFDAAGARRIGGAQEGEVAGVAVAGPGDVDGDTVPDMLVGAVLSSPHGRAGAGAARVVRLRATPPPDPSERLADARFVPNQGLLAGFAVTTMAPAAAVVPMPAPIVSGPPNGHPPKPPTQSTLGKMGVKFTKIKNPQSMGPKTQVRARAKCVSYCSTIAEGRVVRGKNTLVTLQGVPKGTMLEATAREVTFRVAKVGREPLKRAFKKKNGVLQAVLSLTVPSVNILNDGASIMETIKVRP